MLLCGLTVVLVQSKGEFNSSARKVIATNKNLNIAFLEMIEYTAYCISCFANSIWEEYSYRLMPINKEIISIKNVYKKKIYYEENEFLLIIHEINFDKNYKYLKTISLKLTSNNNNKDLNLIDLNFKPDKDRVIFSNLKFKPNSITSILDINHNIIEEKNLVYALKESEKLKYFLDYFRQENLMNEFGVNLAEQFIIHSKQKNIFYSDVIEIFCILIGKKNITLLLDNYERFDYCFDQVVNEEFKNIFDLYKNNPESFIINNKEFFKSAKKEKKEETIKKYNISLENFMLFYDLYLGNYKNIDKQKKANLIPTIINIIKNKRDVIELTWFIGKKLEVFCHLFEKEKKIQIDKELNNFEEEEVLINFKMAYFQLITEEEIKGFIFDYSKIFNKLINIYNQFELLVDIKKVYIREMKYIPNPDFLLKVNDKIHYAGMEKIKQKRDNSFIIKFLKNNDYYKSAKSKKNNKKDFSILKYFNLKAMDNKFFEDYNNSKIYSYFEENYAEYLSFFLGKIKHIKYFGYFFKLLPPKMHNKNTINLIYKWIQTYISTFSPEECPQFKNEIKLFIEIIFEQNSNQNFFSLIGFLKDNIHNDYIHIFAFLLNSNKYDSKFIKENLIRHILFPNGEEEELNDNIYFFLNNVKQNKSIAKIFLEKIKNFSISQDDFFQITQKFMLFEKLLSMEEYNSFLNDDIKLTYWENTKYICQNVVNSLKNLEVTFQFVNTIIKNLGEEKFLNRIRLALICLNDKESQKNANMIYLSINKIISEWKFNISQIEDVKSFFYHFSKRETKFIDQLSKFKLSLFNKELKKLNSEKAQKEFLFYSKYIELANEGLNLRNSLFFNEIYESLKDSIINKNLYDIILKEFISIKNLFVKNKGQIKAQLKKIKQVKYLVNIGYKNRELLAKEINWLLNYFKITNFDLKDFLISELNSILENKSLFSEISGLLQLYDIYKDILDFDSNSSNKNLYKELYNYKGILKNIENTNNIEVSNIIKNIKQKFGFSKEKDLKIISKFFILINQYPESMRFIRDKKLENINNLIEFLSECEDSSLSENDINEFMIIVKYFEKIINKKNILFIDFVSEIIEGIIDKSKCGNIIFRYIENYNFIQSLFNHYLNNTEGCIKKIRKILEKSEFTIQLNKDLKNYEIKGMYIVKSKNDCVFIYILYNELKSLFQRIFMTNVPDKYKDDINKYINFFKNIKALISIINELFEYGYQEKIKFEINVNKSSIECKYKGQVINLEEWVEYFNDIKIKVYESLKKCYNHKPILKLFYGRQLSFIYENIKGKKETNIINLFKVISNNTIKELKKIDISFENLNNENKYDEVINKISDYFELQLKSNGKNLSDIYNFNQIQQMEPLHSSNKKPKKEEFKGIYSYISPQQEIDSLNIYKFMTDNLPINICFLYCNKTTSTEELNAFLLRAIFCDNHILFCMINVNLLNDIQKRKFIISIKKYAKNNGNAMKSCLLIIYSQEDTDLQKILQKIKNIKIFKEPINFINFTFDKDYKISLIDSNYCGLGKSDFIKEQIKKEKLNYIYFPIGGKFTRDDLANRLEELQDMSDIKQKYSIHLDISQTEEVQLLNEFLFKLLILRKCDLYENAKYFGSNVEIIIEIPNDFKDYAKELNLLKYISKKTIRNIEQINLSHKLKIVEGIIAMYESNDIITKNYIETKDIKSEEHYKKKILEYLKTMNLENPNYYQINIFIKILANEFIKFSKCEGYQPKILLNNAVASGMSIENAKKGLELRKFIINSFIQITKMFLISPYEKLIKNQKINQELYSNENKQKYINENLSINIDSSSFDKIKPSMIFFNEDERSCTIITTCNEKDKEFKNLEKVYYLQSTDFKNGKSNLYKKLRNFREFNSNEIFDYLLSFLNVSGLDEKRKKEILGSYVYTPDNFIKVILIRMRLRVKIPVILMGETGCGKTTLIEMASKLINKGKIYLKKMNIHAGIVDKDIIKFIEKVKSQIKHEDDKMYKKKIKEFNDMPEKSRQAYLKNNTEKQIFQGYMDEIKKREIWVFFDELNTCNSMGLLTEILCKNSIYGKPLDKRFIFIASCNPYRILEKRNEELNVLYKTKKTKNLVYSVNPLPMTLLNFVFNFGALKEKDEYNYIESMISGVVNKIFERNKNLKEDHKNKLISIETDCVHICQKFMKKNNDISIVSLREVNRFNIMFEFFIEYIIQRKNNKELIENLYEEDRVNEYYKSKTDIEICYCALNLSLFVCYYLRLPDKKSRQDIENIMNEKNYFKSGFLEIPLMEQNYMINNFEIPKGIAKNKNLKENIFILFVCVINKIPLITLGKPGRSKTLSFKILQNSMQGSSSKSIFLRQYPKIIPFKIQGSLNTTSDEILEVFSKARLSQKNNDDKIIVVFMDEMGLAEISENNPLKVMHSELEKEENKISFVGISNWFIDASKMNRVIYNVVQDPDEEEVIQTGKEIIRSYEEKGENYSSQYGNIIIEMSKAYYEFISTKKQQNNENQYFHGSRDFYSLIKTFINEVIKNKKELEVDNQGKKNELINKICLDSIERNFGGLDDSVDEFKRIYMKQKLDNINNINNIKRYDILKCIKENINDNSSRYLLLINDSSLGKELAISFLEEANKNKVKGDMTINELDNKEDNKIEIVSNKKIKKVDFKKYYSGSKFNYDKNNALYINEIINKIKYQMETENTLILNDLEVIYPILYELFNQSYTYLDGKKFVYLGESKSLSLVNDNFKVIVLVDKDSIKNQEPPFLNRFEKHIINFSYLLDDKSLSLAEEIYTNLNDILKIKVSNLKFEVDKKFKNHMTFINEEEIKGLVYNGIKRFNNFDKEKIIEYVLKKISPCFTEELMILITKYDFRNNNNKYYKIIYNEYKEKYCNNIKSYLEKLIEEISIVYTYSSIEDEIFYDENVKIMNKFLEIEFCQNSINEININTIYSMEQIEKEILDYFYYEENKNNKEEQDLLIIKFRQEDMKKFNDIYFLVNDLRTKMQINGKNKVIIFIIYLSFDNTKNCKASFLLNCPQIMIDNLDNEYTNFNEIINSSNGDIIGKRLINTNLLIKNNLEEVFRYFSFDLVNYEKEISYGMNLNKNYKNIIINEIKANNYLKDYLIESLNIFIKNEEDLIVSIFNEEIFNNKKYENKNEKINHINFMNSLYKYLNNFIFINLRKIIFIFEKEQIISSAITNRNIIDNNIFRKYINEYISDINNEHNSKFIWINKDLNQKITIPIIFGKRLPFCERLFQLLFNFIQNNYASKYIEVDTSLLRIKIKEENIQNHQEKYLNEIKKLDNNLKLELNKYPLITDILNSKDEKLISSFFSDLLYSFIRRNDKLKSRYEDIAFLIDILVQLRIKARLNDNLNTNFLEYDKIELKPTFLDLIKKEENIRNNKLEKEKEKEKEIEKESIENNIKVKNNSIYLNQFVSIINFFQSYSKEIYMILEMYYFLLQNIPTLFAEIKSTIENKKIQMENSDRNPFYSKVNKACFFYIIESMCKIFKEQLTNILKRKQNSVNIKFYQSIKFFIEKALKLERKFLLFSKEIFTLEIIVNLINQSQLKKNETALELTYQAMKNLTSDDKDKLYHIINFINIILVKLFGENSKENIKFMSKLILNRYQNNFTSEYREELFKIVFDNKLTIFNKNVMEYSFPLIYSIFNFSKMEIAITIFQNVENRAKKQDFFSLIKDNPYIKIINNKNNKTINELILYRLEIILENQIKKLINEKIPNLFEKLLSKDNLKEAINFLYHKKFNNQTNFINIAAIYYIAFIKRYLYYFVDTILKEEGFQKLVERESIKKTLFDLDVQQVKIVKYYYLKLILKSWKNWEKMENLDNKGKTIINEDFINEIDSEKKDYQFLLLDIINEQYYIFLEQLVKNKFNEENKKTFDDMFSNNYNYLYTFLSNLLLLSKYQNLKENRDEINLNYFDNLLILIVDYINQDKLYKNLKDILLFLNKLFKENLFREKILPKINLDNSAKNENQEYSTKIKILLFALRFVFSVFIDQNKNMDNKNLFYNNLLSKNIALTLDNCFIPGNFPIEESNNNSLKGFKSVDKSIFEKNENKVREMSENTYRLLNFILYSFIFYSNIEGFIKDKNIVKYVVESMTCFDILQKNWEFLEQCLSIKIELFLNIIFNPIIEKLNKAENFIDKPGVINFEKEIDKIVNKALNDIKIKQKFEDMNCNIVNITPYFSRAIIEEKYKSNLYSEIVYPNLNYFYISEMPSDEDFIGKFNLQNKEEYPILDIIINNKSLKKRIKYLSYLPNFNKICNYMINFCSFKYSRDEAKKTQIEEIKDDDILQSLKEFKDNYKDLMKYLKEEEEFELEEKYSEFRDNLYLSDLCPDISGEKNYGTILLSIYEKMVEWQNSFINKVINSKNEQLNYYKGLFETKIMIQDCNEFQIIKLPNLKINFEENRNNDDNLLYNLIINNSYRKENKIIYNFDEIEEQLASNILLNIESFKSEFRTVIYQYENLYSGKKSGMISCFINKYQQRKLTDKELEMISDSIKEQEYDYKELYFSLQVIIDIIREYNYDPNKAIYSIIGKFSNTYEFKTLNTLFYSIQQKDKENKEINLTVECLIDLIDFIELNFWETIEKNIDLSYQEDIEENILKQFDKYLEENYFEKNNFKISKNDLCSAIRKYITRYLYGKSNKNINLQMELKNNLINVELWPINYDIKAIEKDINTIFEGTKIRISQALKLFYFLKNEKINKEEKINNVQEEEEEDDDKSKQEKSESEEDILPIYY